MLKLKKFSLYFCFETSKSKSRGKKKIMMSVLQRVLLLSGILFSFALGKIIVSKLILFRTRPTGLRKFREDELAVDCG